MSALNRSNSFLESEIENLYIQNKTLIERLGDLTTELESAKNSSVRHKNELQMQIAELNKNISAYEKRIADLEKKLDKPEEPDSKEEEEPVDKFNYASGWRVDPRHNVHLKSGRIFNTWNKCAPFGISVGAWEEDDRISVVRKGGGLGIDPYILTNLDLEKSSVVGHLKKQ